MKERDTMNRFEVDKILKVPFYARQMLPWEHCAKAFYSINIDRALEILKKIESENAVLKCETNNGPYYFGIGLDDCILSEELLGYLCANGKWYVYTYAD